MYRIEFETKPGKWKRDFVKIRDRADAEAYMKSFERQGISARLIEEGEGKK